MTNSGLPLSILTSANLKNAVLTAKRPVLLTKLTKCALKCKKPLQSALYLKFYVLDAECV